MEKDRNNAWKKVGILIDFGTPGGGHASTMYRHHIAAGEGILVQFSNGTRLKSKWS